MGFPVPSFGDAGDGSMSVNRCAGWEKRQSSHRKLHTDEVDAHLKLLSRPVPRAQAGCISWMLRCRLGSVIIQTGTAVSRRIQRCGFGSLGPNIVDCGTEELPSPAHRLRNAALSLVIGLTASSVPPAATSSTCRGRPLSWTRQAGPTRQRHRSVR